MSSSEIVQEQIEALRAAGVEGIEDKALAEALQEPLDALIGDFEQVIADLHLEVTRTFDWLAEVVVPDWRGEE